MTVYDQLEKDSVNDTESHFLKTDAVTGEALEGAVLQILDQEGKLVEEWTSEKEHHVISELPEENMFSMKSRHPMKKGMYRHRILISKYRKIHLRQR